MKKAMLIICIALSVFSTTSCKHKQDGITNNVVVNIQKSGKFSKEEITEAINCVKIKFKDFKGCALTKLWYDEEKSNDFIKGYLKDGKDIVNGINVENMIVLLSNFDVDSSGADEGFNPNSTYSGWNWVLVRETNKDDWKISNWGY